MLKIPHSIQQCFNELNDLYLDIQPKMEEVINKNILVDKHWLFFSRIKTAESFYSKIQMGRPDAILEDFLAGTIVVNNFSQISEVETLLKTFFELKYRKPEYDSFTSKRPEDFSFDDLRVYLTMKDRDCNPNQQKAIFEIQVKSFLQHAWTVATHDLIYKPIGGADWALARVAFQIKAMLEHAEVSLTQADFIAKSKILEKQDKHYSEILRIQIEIEKRWSNGIKNSCKRTAESISQIIRIAHCSIEDLFTWIDADTKNGRGASLLSFSPYEISLEAIIEHMSNAQEVFRKKLLGERSKTAIIVSTEFMENHPDYKGIFTEFQSLLQKH